MCRCKYLHLFMLAVDGQFAGRGIGQELIRRCIENGYRKGYQKALTEATGKISQHIFRKNGFVQRFCVPYRSFMYEGRLVFASIQGHEGAMLMDRSINPVPQSAQGLRRTSDSPEACFWPTSGLPTIRHVSVNTRAKSLSEFATTSSSAGSALPKIALKQKPRFPDYQRDRMVTSAAANRLRSERVTANPKSTSIAAIPYKRALGDICPEVWEISVPRETPMCLRSWRGVSPVGKLNHLDENDGPPHDCKKKPRARRQVCRKCIRPVMEISSPGHDELRACLSL